MAFSDAAHATLPFPDVTITQARTAGALGQKMVAEIARHHADEIAFCGRRTVAISPTDGADVQLAFLVRRGKATRITDISGPGHQESINAFARCMERRILRWEFPPPVGTTAVDITAHLSVAAPDTTDDTPLAQYEVTSRQVEEAARTLAREGALYTIDRYVMAAMRGGDPCANAWDEFERLRCKQTSGVLMNAAHAQLAGGFVYVSGVIGSLSEFQAQTGTFTVSVNPILVPGGIGTPHAPEVTHGKLDVSERDGRPGDIDIKAQEVQFDTHPMAMTEAEHLAHRTAWQLDGVALVVLVKSYEVPLRTDDWYRKRDDTTEWRKRVAAGTSEEQDLFVTLYGVDVVPVAYEFYHPDTGAAVARWVAPGYALQNQDGRVRPVQTFRP